MRDLETRDRLTGLTLPEIVREWEAAVLGIRNDFAARGRRLNAGYALNAVVLDWLMKPEAERREAVARGLAEFVRLSELDGPGEVGHPRKAARRKAE